MAEVLFWLACGLAVAVVAYLFSAIIIDGREDEHAIREDIHTLMDACQVFQLQHNCGPHYCNECGVGRSLAYARKELGL